MSDLPVDTRAATSRPVQILRTTLAVILAFAVLAQAADLYRLVGWMFLGEQFLAAMLGLALVLVFIHYPARRGEATGQVEWYDWLCAAAGAAACAYVAWNYAELSTDFFSTPIGGLISSWVIFLLCIEGLRRSVGMSLVWVVLFFIGYALIGHLVPGSLQTRQVEINRFIIYLGLDTSGLFGIVMQVAATVVIPFILFGVFLSASGGAAFFNDLAIALMGRYRGGAAKIAVTASGLFGSISGVVVSNIMATGVITIPLMKRTGFTPAQAGAIEASASNGGQLMPPVMGAVAFLMADFLQRPYRDIAIAAFIPALLYYIALFIQTDLTAARNGIKPVPREDIPALGQVLKRGWYFAIPFAVLIYCLFSLNQEPEVAAFWASVSVLAIGFAFGYGGQRMTLRSTWESIVSTGLGSLDIFMVAAAAGFIMGMLQLTGLGFALTVFLVQLGEGNLLLLLIIAAAMCVVLGMGMPTIGVYVLLAVLVAPSLEKVGVSQLAAHMFILYLGLMSMVTPPVAIAAFFAASIAGAEPMKTGWTATAFSWPAYIVPFLFVFSPTLLLQSSSVFDTVLAVVTAIVGVWVMCAGMVGYSFLPLNWPRRIGLLLGGFGLLLPHEIGLWAVWANVGGALLSAVLLMEQWNSARRAKLQAAPQAG